MARRPLLLAVATLAVLAVGVTAAPAQGALDARIREAALDRDGTTRLTLSVTGSAVGDRALDATAFAVTEDGRGVDALAVEPLLEQRTRSVAVALLLDVSGSTRGEPLDRAKAGASAFVADLAADGVRVAVGAFSESAEFLTPFTTDTGVLTGAMDRLEPAGETALYDAVSLAAGELSGIDGVRNIVVFSDGGDTVSEAGLAESVSAAADAGAPVTTVALETEELDRGALQQLASGTGGQVVAVEETTELAGAFDSVVSVLSSQYVLTYTGSTHDTDELDLAVSVTAGGASATDDIRVVNPRVVAPPVPADPRTVEVGDPGLLGSSVGLYLGLGAAFVALLLLFGLLVVAARNQSGGRRLRQALTVYTEGGGRDAAASWNPADLGHRAGDLLARLPKPEGFDQRLQLELDRAGWPMRANEFLALQAVAGIGGLAVGFAVFGTPLIAIPLAVVALVAPRLVVRRKVETRANRFHGQLPDTLGLLAGSLRAGYGLTQAIDTVVKEAPAPTSTEFGRVLSETRLGMPLEDALYGMADRIDSEDFRWVVMAIAIQREVGGNLAHLLDTVAGTLREREQVRRQIKTLSAEGRLSAIVLIALPFLLVGYLALVNPDYLGTLFERTVGRVMVGGAVVFMAVGIVWIRKVIRIEV